jgi:hypothetical protein
MAGFLRSYGDLRKLIGDDQEMNERLNSLLLFPYVRAIVWEVFVKKFAALTRDVEEKAKN